MANHATIIDFLSISLSRNRQEGVRPLSPNEQLIADQLAARLDHKLAEVVQELEKVASCQQEDDGQEVDKNPPFEAFCAGMHQIGATLIPHLAQVYIDFKAENKLEGRSLDWIIKARSDAFIGYLMELAKVHGVAFDLNVTQIGDRETRILAQLEKDLRSLSLEAISAA
jgi:hypothetical protein